MKCFADGCMQRPELRQTGWHPPHPTHFCPICRESYWMHEVKSDRNWKIGEHIKPYPPTPYYTSPSKAKMLSSGQYAWVTKKMIKEYKRELKEEEDLKHGV